MKKLFFYLCSEKPGGGQEDEDSGYFVAENGVEFSLTPLNMRRQHFEARPASSSKLRAVLSADSASSRQLRAVLSADSATRPPYASTQSQPVTKPCVSQSPPSTTRPCVIQTPTTQPHTGHRPYASQPPASHGTVARLVDPCPPIARPLTGRAELVASPVQHLEAVAAHALCVKSASVPYIEEEQEVLKGIHLVDQLKRKFLKQQQQ